jgi:hypothetical protein
MPTFNNLKDLEKWIQTNHGQNHVLGGSYGVNESNIVSILTEAGQELEKLMIAELDSYFDSYSPTVYSRTGNTVKSIKVGKPRKVSVNEWSLAITFDEGLANHRSYIGADQPDGYVPWLLEVGWNIEDKVQPSRPMFTNHHGTHYITNAVEKFNASNTHGLKVTVEHNGQRYI